MFSFWIQAHGSPADLGAPSGLWEEPLGSESWALGSGPERGGGDPSSADHRPLDRQARAAGGTGATPEASQRPGRVGDPRLRQPVGSCLQQDLPLVPELPERPAEAVRAAQPWGSGACRIRSELPPRQSRIRVSSRGATWKQIPDFESFIHKSARVSKNSLSGAPDWLSGPTARLLVSAQVISGSRDRALRRALHSAQSRLEILSPVNKRCSPPNE